MICGGRVVGAVGAGCVGGLVEPLVPPAKEHPQGGGMSRVDDWKVFTAIMFVLTSGCAWRHLPPSSGVRAPTARWCFMEWTKLV